MTLREALFIIALVAAGVANAITYLEITAERSVAPVPPTRIECRCEWDVAADSATIVHPLPDPEEESRQPACAPERSGGGAEAVGSRKGSKDER